MQDSGAVGLLPCGKICPIMLPVLHPASMHPCRCVAFTFEPSTGCGYLKSAPFYKERTGWVAYTRD
jgi:hypothetical protein